VLEMELLKLELIELLDVFIIDYNEGHPDDAIDTLEEGVQELEEIRGSNRLTGLVLNIIRTYNMTTSQEIKSKQVLSLKSLFKELSK
jgi:hypothetical protein